MSHVGKRARQEQPRALEEQQRPAWLDRAGARVGVREGVRVVTRGLGGHENDYGIYLKVMDGLGLCDKRVRGTDLG